MRPEPLSSQKAYVTLKYITPMWYALLGLLFVAAAILPGGTTIVDVLPPFGRVLLVIVAPLATVAYVAYLWDLKYVELAGDQLLVSGLHRKTAIPLTEIADLRQDFIEPGYPIYVDLKHEGVFGKAFSFVALPPPGWGRREEYPVVGRLRALVHAREKDATDGAAA